MSLRTRLAVGTARSLALAICAGLAAAYLVVRGQLGGEIDTSLKERERAGRLHPHRRNGTLPPPAGRAPASRRASPARRGNRLRPVRPPDGKITLPEQERVRLPTTGARAVAAGTRPAFFRDATVAGTHLRIYTAPGSTRHRRQIARPLTEVDHALARIRPFFVAGLARRRRRRGWDRAARAHGRPCDPVTASPRTPNGSRQPATSASAPTRPGRTSSAASQSPSTPCSTRSPGRSPHRDSSSPTPRTSSAPRSPPPARTSTSSNSTEGSSRRPGRHPPRGDNELHEMTRPHRRASRPSAG